MEGAGKLKLEWSTHLGKKVEKPIRIIHKVENKSNIWAE